MANKTRNDAWERVSDAKMGSGVKPTDEFLAALEQYLHQWLSEIKEQRLRLPEPRVAEEFDQEDAGELAMG
jgi:hypothetical protein